VILGKTNTPEFGTTAVTEPELHGPCRNPWDTARTPGGSSGGAAAAVAAGLAPVAHGSDGGGSIRIPASCCGLFGLKPVRGRISTAPYGDLYGFSTNGALARTVADSAVFLDAIAGPEPGDQYRAPPPERPFADEAAAPPGRLRVALALAPPMPAPVDPECADAARDAAALLAELGHDVDEVEPPWQSDALLDLFLVVWQTIPALYPGIDLSRLEPMNRLFAERAAATSSVEYLRAMVQLQAYGRRIAAFCAGFDLVVTPGLALPPVPVGWVGDGVAPEEQFVRAAQFTPFTPAVNVAGLAAASVPLAWSRAGLPLGTQLIAAAGEPVLLRVAAQLEAARPWAGRRPPVS
jgi:amidase